MINNVQYNFRAKYNTVFEEFIKKIPKFEKYFLQISPLIYFHNF